MTLARGIALVGRRAKVPARSFGPPNFFFSRNEPTISLVSAFPTYVWDNIGLERHSMRSSARLTNRPTVAFSMEARLEGHPRNANHSYRQRISCTGMNDLGYRDGADCYITRRGGGRVTRRLLWAGAPMSKERRAAAKANRVQKP